MNLNGQSDKRPTERDHEVRILFVAAISLAASMGGLLFGWDWVVIGGAKPFFERYFEISTDPALSGWANSCALLGCFVGAISGGTLSDRFGRKKPLLVAALLFGITSVGNALADTFHVFVAWRILGGVAIGLASTLSPLYIAEVSPARLRGRLVALNQLAIVIGVLAAQLINWWIVSELPQGASDAYIASSWYGQTAWRWMFAITAIPSIIFLVAMAFAPESPRWLAKHQPAKARALLEKIGGPSYAASALADISRTLLRAEDRVDWRALLAPTVRRALVMGIVLAIFQQWCGINVIFNYAEEIFRAAGFDISGVVSSIAWTGSVNLAFTLLAIGLVDRVGRRPLMLFGAASLAATYAVLGICFGKGMTGIPMLALVLTAIACYAVSLAPVTWVLISEIFPNRVRGAAIAIAVGSLWLASFALTYSFPIMNAKLGAAGVFFIYALICVAGLVFLTVELRETKGRTLEELEDRAVN